MSETTKNPEQYWANLEREIGEKILFYTLGQSLTPMGEKQPVPIWGLFYITQTRLFFRHFPKSGKLSVFGFGGSPTVDDPETFSVPRDTFVRVEILAKKKWWLRLFSSSMPAVVVEYRTEGGGTAEFRFILERKHDEFLDLLRLQ